MASLQGPDGTRASSTLKFFGEEFVFDTVSGMFYRMNRTACFILRALDSGIDPGDLPTLLEARYGLDHATAVRDAALFLNDLAALEPLDRFCAGGQEAA